MKPQKTNDTEDNGLSQGKEAVPEKKDYVTPELKRYVSPRLRKHKSYKDITAQLIVTGPTGGPSP
jgi:hypothetical protein